MRWSLLLLALAACDSTAPLVGTPIGRFAVTAQLDTTNAASCRFTGSSNPLTFDALLSYDPPYDPGSTPFWLTVDSTDPRQGRLTGLTFDTFAPPGPSDCADPTSACNQGVVREISDCHDCRITVVEEIDGSLFKPATDPASPDQLKGEDPGVTACLTADPPSPPAPQTLDPSVFSAICGTVVDTIRFENDPADQKCTCDEKNNPAVWETDPQGASKCTILYRFHGTRS